MTPTAPRGHNLPLCQQQPRGRQVGFPLSCSCCLDFSAGRVLLAVVAELCFGFKEAQKPSAWEVQRALCWEHDQ